MIVQAGADKQLTLSSLLSWLTPLLAAAYIVWGTDPTDSSSGLINYPTYLFYNTIFVFNNQIALIHNVAAAGGTWA